MKIQEIKNPPDYSEIIDLINAEWPKEYSCMSDEEKINEMEKSHDNESDTVKYLYDEKKIIGFYRYSKWPREGVKTETAHLFDISILPERQKQGLGTLLMKDMMNDCKIKGFKKVLSRTFKNNEGSILLHKSLGFSLYLEIEDSFIWEIEL
jgi:L-amino acid N-acyltransferase YncA